MKTSLKKPTVVYSALMAVMLIWILSSFVIAPNEAVGTLKFIPSVFTAVYLAFAINFSKYTISNENKFLALGIFLIMPADFFLCLLYNCGIGWAQPVGYALFCLVEISFAIWLGCGKINIVSRIVVCMVMEALLYKHGKANFPNALAVVNLSQLIVNVFTAWIGYFKNSNKKNVLFELGITLFACCDYGILIRTFMPTGSMVFIALNMMVWVCYIPCQVLLALSFVKSSE